MNSYRPWGNFEIIATGDTYQVKKLTVKPNEKLSLQYHNYRSEKWIVVSGAGKAVISDAELQLSVGDYVQIEAKQIHRLINDSNNPLVIIEIQIGTIIEESDIVRIEDIYGRS